MGDTQIQRVLVVDDDVVMLRSFRQALERNLRVSTFTATSHELALDLARKHRPQLAIIDLQLGAESGLDVLRELRSLDAHIVLVMISGYGSIDMAVRAMKAGADEFIEKPVTPHEIFFRIQAISRIGRVLTPSADRALWEHVHRVLGDCKGNKSEAARRLRRPRSWLRRFLGRTAPL